MIDQLSATADCHHQMTPEASAQWPTIVPCVYLIGEMQPPRGSWLVLLSALSILLESLVSSFFFRYRVLK